MSREYQENRMLKSNGILYFPPVKDFSEALSIYKECGGMIISLEEDGFLVEEPAKISKLYTIPPEQLEIYFRDVLKSSDISAEEVDKIITEWLIEENIPGLSI